MTKDENRLQNYAENIAAISADFHTNKHYDDFYKAFADKLGGFTGIYQLVIKMAKIVRDWEEMHGDDYVSHGWVEMLEHFVTGFYDDALRDNELPALEPIFARAREKAAYKVHHD